MVEGEVGSEVEEGLADMGRESSGEVSWEALVACVRAIG